MTDCNPDDPTRRMQSPTRKRAKRSLSLKRKDHNEDDSRFETPHPDDPTERMQSPPRKKVKKSLLLKQKDGNDDDSHFKSPKKPLETYQKCFCPENTKVNIRWAVKNFKEWAACHNKRHPENLCPSRVLLSNDAEEVSMWLQKYVLGTRKTNGE